MTQINSKNVDRRVQRTRRLLRQALMSLIMEKDYNSITVQNIIDRANLGRSTFYAHYRDKEDLLVSNMEEVIHSLLQGVDNSPDEDVASGERPRILSSLPIFRHAQEQHRLHKAMIGGEGIDLFIKTTHSHLAGHIQQRIDQLLPDEQTLSVPSPIVAHHLAGALLTLLTWWLDNDMPYPPERMDEIFQQLTMPGIWTTLRERRDV